MSRNAIVTLWLALAAAVAWSRAAHAQGTVITYGTDTTWTGYRSEQARAQCHEAAQVLTHAKSGGPDRTPAYVRRTAMLNRLGGCGPLGGHVLAALFSDHRTDTTPTAELEQIVLASREFIDGTLYSAALGVASDPGASPVARVQAIRIIYGMFHPSTVTSYDAFVADSVIGRDFFPVETSYGTPLPASARVDVRTTMDRLMKDESVPVIVRHAAAKLASP